MKCIFLAIGLLSAFCGLSQKPPIDSGVYGKWPSVENASISNDGKYAAYVVNDQPIGDHTSVLLATNNSWKMEWVSSPRPQFTNDSRTAIVMKSKDSLAIIDLRTSSARYIPNVSSFRLPGKGTGEWLAYQVQNAQKELVLCNVATGKVRSFADVIEYVFDDNGTTLLLQVGGDRNGKMSLQWINLQTDNVISIWEGVDISDINFNDSGTQLAFIGNDGKSNAIFFYKPGQSHAEFLADNQSPGIDSGMSIDYLQGFNGDGSHLFFSLKKSDSLPQPNPQAVQVDVWSYTDPKLQSQQLKELSEHSPFRNYLAVINTQNHRIIRLQQDKDEKYYQHCGDFVLFGHKEGGADPTERQWNPAWKYSAYIVSIKEGGRVKIKNNMPLYFGFSPEGKYVIYYDFQKMNYFCYTRSTGQIRNITGKIATNWTTYDGDRPNSNDGTYSIAGWLRGDDAVLLYDQNDIWEVDLTGSKPPVNLTNGFGRKHHIVFHLALPGGEPVLAINEKILLSAFNRTTKDNGYYSKIIGKAGDPDSLTMGPYVYYIPDNRPGIPGERPLKALDTEAYILRRMSATESPNYFYTTDFGTFIPLSHVYPERKYNWLTTSLLTWKMTDGTYAQGILYKPENFDPNRKYPVIFYYYERLSDRLHVYQKPETSSGSLNIAWYVSHGYLVFTPDIHYKIGMTGKSALNAIVSAALFMSTMNFVDAGHMGIQGHSFGGVQTNYILTHTHLFAAACSASGLFDFISGYNSIGGGGASLQDMYELTQFRMGATLWQRPDLYIENSAIFRADQVTTPFLMMHTANDGICPFTNALEFFIALRRLGKKVWMLQYDDYNHSLSGKAADDFTIRMQQFFDHYLKGAPAPKWMVQGIPAELKGVEDGLQPDDK